mgnify:CR=1 FL=1
MDDPSAPATDDDDLLRPTSVHFSHVTTQRYLPTPGKAPGWPFAEIGHWQVDANRHADDWIEGLQQWRREHLVRLGWTDAHYRRPELQWAQRNFVNVQMMVEDRFFYDPVAGRYTVDRYLDDLEQRYGGFYRPSPGLVYPTLQLLEEEGNLTSQMVNDKKVYTITEAGKALLAQRDAEHPMGGRGHHHGRPGTVTRPDGPRANGDYRGSMRSRRSSCAWGVPRPSRLLVPTYTRPSGATAMPRSRPYVPSNSFSCALTLRPSLARVRR